MPKGGYSTEAPPLELSLPRLPCDGPNACGVLMCMHTHGRPAKDLAFVREGVLAARVLRAVARPAHPLALFATDDARALLSATEAALWDVHRPLRLNGPIGRMQQAMQRRQNGWSRSWEKAARLSFVHKLQALLDTPFARTVFVDCDLFVLDASLIDSLLTQTLRIAELAMPLDPWRGGAWAAAPMPPLCSALTAYRSDAQGMRQLIVDAAGRLINGSERNLHPDVNPSDQTGLWFAHVHSAGVAGTDASSPSLLQQQRRQRLRVVALPEEALCAGEPLSSTHVLAGSPPKPRLQAFAYRHSSWVGPKGSDRRGDYRCRAVHGHEYTEEQLAPILGGGEARARGSGGGGGARAEDALPSASAGGRRPRRRFGRAGS